MLKKSTGLLIIAIVYTCILIYASLSNVNGILPDIEIEFSDKIMHFGAYLALSIFWGFYSLSLNIKNNLRLSFLGTLLFGVLLELFQEIINPIRTFEILDLLANCIGVIIGTIIVAFIKRHKLKSE